jgi:hypothetical protein
MSTCFLSFGPGHWTKDELIKLRDSLGDAIDALNKAGYDGKAILDGIRFVRNRDGGDSMAFPSNTIRLSGVSKQLIWHEIGHSISFRNGHDLQNIFHERIQLGVMTGYLELNEFCYRQYCHRQYPRVLQWYTGQNPEYWADAFAVWMYMRTYPGATPPSSWVRNNYTPGWLTIVAAVEYSLRVVFNP